MSKVLVNDSTLSDIADALREKSGGTETYLPSEMAPAVEAIEQKTVNYNLMQGTGDYDGWYYPSSATGTISFYEEDGDYVASIADPASMSWSNAVYGIPFDVSELAGEVFLITAYIRCPDYETFNADNSENASVQVQLSVSLYTDDTQTKRNIYTAPVIIKNFASGEWTHYGAVYRNEKATYTSTDSGATSSDFDDQTHMNLRVFNYSYSTIEIKKIKIEVFDWPDWCLAEGEE